MGERTQYTPGTFSWADLTTTDVEGAKAFYAGVFGWRADDVPVPDGGIYSMQFLGEQPVSAISAQPEQQREMGVPPLWNSYVTVDSADSTAARAGELGATVHAPPFDVMDVGRMAVIQDPQGAFFMVWEPRSHIGAGLVNAHGALSWNELASPDLTAAPGFYGALFGWTVQPFEGSETPYQVIQNAGRGNGGMREKTPQEPPYWLVYFGSDDIDASLARVTELGGKLVAGPFPMGDIGKVAMAQDPQGAIFALYAGQFED